jgi:V/A-type H+-transporting ATPase subunit E
MQNKLQELTDKLYEEGLSKGKKEAEELKEKAQQEAAEIIAKAKEEYKEILEKAKKDTEDYRLKVENEIKMTSSQALAKVKQTIEQIVITKATSEPVKKAMDNKEFLGDIIKLAVESFNSENGDATSLEVLLPESKKEELEKYIKDNITTQLNSGVEFGYDKKIQTGFKIGPKGDSYYISFTDKDFQELLSQYLKPATRKFLFSA